MPGVPSYRGCDACRKQKKKCDQAKPACSRCSRLKIQCTGVGTQRFGFKDESKKFAKRSGLSRTSRPKDTLPVPLLLFRTPSSDKSRLAGETVRLLEVSHPGYDVHCYGAVMKELPRRVGHHVALDAAVVAFLGTATCMPSKLHSSECLNKYVAALSALQRCLQEKSTAYTADTLCAVYLVSICHAWMARQGDRPPSHGRGLLHLMNHLVSYRSEDEFVVKAILNVTGVLIYESIFNHDIDLDPWIWAVCAMYSPKRVQKRPSHEGDCVGARLVFQSCEHETLAMVAKLMRRPEENMERIHSLYAMVRAEYDQLKTFGATVMAPLRNTPSRSIDAIRAQTSYHEVQAIMLAICISFNAFLRTSHFASPRLNDERSSFCTDAVVLAQEGKLGRPLAALHIPMSTTAAWLVSAEEAQRAELRELLDEYQGNFGMLHFAGLVSRWENAPSELRKLSWFRTTAQAGDGQAPKRRASKKDVYQNCCIL